jgi:hypothetical protein
MLGLEAEREMLCRTLSARDAVKHVLELREEKSMQVITLMWHWWLERNRVREGEQKMDAAKLAYIVRKNSEDFLAIGSSSKAPVHRVRKKWERPGVDVPRINCDGAFRSETSQGGRGFVIRDAAGQVIKAGAGSCPHLLDALHAEMLVCLEGVRTAGRWE